MTTFEQLQHKRDQILEVTQKHGVASIRVFGSVARREDSPESDIDLLVVTGPNTTSWFPAGLILDLEALLARRVEVVTERGLSPYLRDRVLGEAVAL